MAPDSSFYIRVSQNEYIYKDSRDSFEKEGGSGISLGHFHHEYVCLKSYRNENWVAWQKTDQRVGRAEQGLGNESSI